MATHRVTGWGALALMDSLALSGGGGGASKSSSGATHPWIDTRQLGVAGACTYGRSVATDADGNVHVAGLTTGGLDGNTLTGNPDFFVTKYDSAGVKQ